MISLAQGLPGALLAVILWSALGLATIKLLLPGRSPLIAPALGYALFHPPALLVLGQIGMDRFSVLAVIAPVLGVALWQSRRLLSIAGVLRLAPVLALAALLAIGPALVDLPKMAANGTHVAIQIFDHSKVALIDEMIRSGLPVANPFVGPGVGTLAYYYLWHFAAAVTALATGSNGWVADMALTWTTAFASLTLMMGIAGDWSGKRAAAYWVLLLSLAVSLRPFLNATVLGYDFGDWITGYPGLQAWFCQASWVPQHLASANCLCVAMLLMTSLRQATGWRDGLAQGLALGITVAAAFESSSYIGGVTLAAALPLLAASLLSGADRRQIQRSAVWAVLAAMVTLILIAPFLRDQAAGLAARGITRPIDFSLFEVFGPKIPEAIRRWLDVPGFWLVQLPIDLPAIYGLGLWGYAAGIGQDKDRLGRRLIASISLVGLLIPWLLTSTIANNDLGWRALLPAVMGLTVCAAGFLATTDWRKSVLWLTLLPLAMAVFGGASYFGENLQGDPKRWDPSFAASAELWAAVRANSTLADRIANNPLAHQALLPWPVNLSWALMADRRSCFAGQELALAYASWPASRTDQAEALFERLFAGDPSAADLDAIGRDYGCDVIVLTPQDGAWLRDPFAGNPSFRLVSERSEGWRIYRRQN